MSTVDTNTRRESSYNISPKFPCQNRSPSSTVPPRRRFRWVVNASLPLALAIGAAIFVLLPALLPSDGRLALFTLILAAILWSTTSIDPAYVALASVMLLVVTGSTTQEQLFASLASDVVWLTIGAFILGGAVQKTGLAVRLTRLVVARSKTVGSLFWLLTGALIPLSFLIPSTSARAAVTIPVFQSITRAAGDKRITRALALLIPTIILVSTIVSLVGAGSHFVANDLLEQIAGKGISFTEWAIYGLPFGIVASYLSCWVIMSLFLNKSILDRPLSIATAKQKPLSSAEWKTIIIVVIILILWFTENWHGLKIATISVFGALLLTLPNFGVFSWKEGIKAVSWNLVIFVGSAVVLGRTLINSGAAQWIIERIFVASGIVNAGSPFPILLFLAFICLTSHLYVTSHTARTAALVPALLYLASSLQLDPVAVLFISIVGMDYCLTFPVSSKALLIFTQIEGTTYQPADLLRLSSVMLLVHFGLILLFYYTYWHWIGLAL
ncbi:MAG: SLC13 family permease [Prochloraceae cyanobacterium]|nr:SLC13 family permease [Prochloraceae cyanobacterium]